MRHNLVSIFCLTIFKMSLASYPIEHGGCESSSEECLNKFDEIVSTLDGNIYKGFWLFFPPLKKNDLVLIKQGSGIYKLGKILSQRYQGYKVKLDDEEIITAYNYNIHKAFKSYSYNGHLLYKGKEVDFYFDKKKKYIIGAIFARISLKEIYKERKIVVSIIEKESKNLRFTRVYNINFDLDK